MEVLTFEYQGREWHYDSEAIGVDEWRELKRKYKMTPGVYETALDEADPDAVTFFYWIMLRQNGGTTQPLGDHLKPDILQLNHAVAEAALKVLKARAEEQAEPGPTNPTSVSPDGSTTVSPSPPAAPSQTPQPQEVNAQPTAS